MGSAMSKDGSWLIERSESALLLQQVNQPRQAIDSGLNMRGADIDTALGSRGFHCPLSQVIDGSG